MKSLLFLVCAVLFVGILVAGCTTQTPVPTPTTVPTPVPTTLATVATTAPPLTDPALTGTWTYKGAMFASGSAKMPVISNTQSITLTFNNDGTFAGFGGCNNYNGGYTLGGKTTDFGKTITLGPIATTQKFCADTSDFESTYLKVLQQTVTYSPTSNTMILRTSYGDQISYDKS
jgi:heat shock protein HslJ